MSLKENGKTAGKPDHQKDLFLQPCNNGIDINSIDCKLKGEVIRQIREEFKITCENNIESNQGAIEGLKSVLISNYPNDPHLQNLQKALKNKGLTNAHKGIMIIQAALKILDKTGIGGADIKIDGDFGKNTFLALIKYQTGSETFSRGATGIVDLDSINSLTIDLQPKQVKADPQGTKPNNKSENTQASLIPVVQPPKEPEQKQVPTQVNIYQQNTITEIPNIKQPITVEPLTEKQRKDLEKKLAEVNRKIASSFPNIGVFERQTDPKLHMAKGEILIELGRHAEGYYNIALGNYYAAFKDRTKGAYEKIIPNCDEAIRHDKGFADAYALKGYMLNLSQQENLGKHYLGIASYLRGHYHSAKDALGQGRGFGGNNRLGEELHSNLLFSAKTHLALTQEAIKQRQKVVTLVEQLKSKLKEQELTTDKQSLANINSQISNARLEIYKLTGRSPYSPSSLNEIYNSFGLGNVDSNIREANRYYREGLKKNPNFKDPEFEKAMEEIIVANNIKSIDTTLYT